MLEIRDEISLETTPWGAKAAEARAGSRARQSVRSQEDRVGQARQGAGSDHGDDADLVAPQGDEGGDCDEQGEPLEGPAEGV